MTTAVSDGGEAAGGAAAGGAAGAAPGAQIDALFGGGDAAGDDAAGGAGTPAWWEADPFKLSTEKPDADKLSHAEWLANKKYGSFEDVVKAHRELETKIGEKGLILPKAADDPAWADVWKTLGRPDDPKGYAIPLPEGDDGAFAEQFRPVAHELGLSATQVTKLAEWFNGLADQSATLNAEAARAELQKEWGGQLKANMELAARARDTFGLDAVAVEKIASGYGLTDTIKLLAQLGRAVGEGGGLPGGKGQGFQQSIEQMRARKTEIVKSTELSRKLMDGDPTLKAEWDAINAAEAAELDKAGG